MIGLFGDRRFFGRNSDLFIYLFFWIVMDKRGGEENIWKWGFREGGIFDWKSFILFFPPFFRLKGI